MKRNRTMYVAVGALLIAGLAGGATAAFAQQTSPAGSSGGVSAADDSVIAPSISDLAQTVMDHSESNRGAMKMSSPEALIEQAALARTVETGTVSDDDYEANHRIYAECLTAAGYAPEFRKSSDGFYVQLPFHNVSDSEALDAALTECSTNTAAVDMIFRLQEANPQLLSDSRVVASQCLVDNDYVDAGYSPEQFEKDWLSDDFPFNAAQAGPNDCLWGAGYGYFAEGK